eukprot:SAG22_NODE_10907_length_510_cov_1.591241_1_plen_86_part_10
MVEFQDRAKPAKGSRVAMVTADSEAADLFGGGGGGGSRKRGGSSAGNTQVEIFGQPADDGDLGLLLPEEDTYDTRLFIHCANLELS